MKKATAKNSKSAVKKNTYFPIVAIGASAGGLEAITELLKNLPFNTGMAFIYVQHLSPDHKSLLTEILSHATKMIVQEADDMEEINPNSVYVIPHNKGIEVIDGHLKLIPRSGASSAISIDVFFSSLAKAHKERVIGVILSGSGSDGTHGLKVIKNEGGLTFAQNDTAKFSSMPHSAVAADTVDFILSPKEIAAELTRLSKHPYINKSGLKTAKEDLIDMNNPDLRIILTHLLKTSRVDFSVYKINTIKRRIIRRMLLYKLKSLKEYVALLREKNEESEMLHQDLLINVTSFFRDAETYKYIKTMLLPKILKRKKHDEPLRIWVPACSTGEEAYSLAMLLSEIQGGNRHRKLIQIFATDLSKQAIDKARLGVYTKQELESVSPKRLQSFFTKSNEGYRVNRDIREMCAFAPHNILTDPPFSRIDFISCCNLFIYLDTAAQRSALNTFHYALNDDGFLMLGKSETVSSSPNFFIPVNKKVKIFSRKKSSTHRTLPSLLQGSAQNQNNGKEIADKRLFHSTVSRKKIAESSQNLDSAIDALLVSDYMPASVVINRQMEIIQFRGATELYLKHPKGKATFNILKMAHPEVAFELRNAISSSIKTKNRIRKSGIEMKIAGVLKNISIDVMPLKIKWDEQLYLIIFTEQNQIEILTEKGKNSKSGSLVKDKRIKKLEEELATAHNEALAASQEQEAVNEELQSANEEVVSSNEELQTVNEELQTSKEELESANEELITANQELLVRNDQLNESYDYVEAISDTIYEPMVVLDKNMRVKSANRSFYKEFNLTEDEIEGEVFFDFGNKQWNIPKLRDMLEDILAKNSQFQDFEIFRKFPKIGERVLLLNARKILQKSKSEQLILLAIQDITETKKKSLELQKKEKDEIALKAKLEAFRTAQANMRGIFMKAPAYICILKGPDHIFELANERYMNLIGLKDILGKPIREVFPELIESGIFDILDKVYQNGVPFEANEMPFQFFKDNIKEEVIVNFVYQASYDSNNQIDGVLVYATDVTEQVLLRDEIRKSEKKYRELIMGLPVAVYTCNAEGYVQLYNQAAEELWGIKPEIGKDKWCGSWKIYNTDGSPLPLQDCPMALSIKEKRSVSFEILIERPDGTRRSIIPNPQIIFDAEGNITGAINTLIDITPQVEARKKVEESETRYNLMLMQSPFAFLILKGKEMVVQLANDSMKEVLGKGSDIEGKPLLEVLPEIKDQAFPDLLNKVFETGIPFIANEMLAKLKRNGILEDVYFNYVYQPYYEADGTISGVTVIAYDVTNAVVANKKIEESEKQFSTLANKIQNLAWMANPDGWVFWYNSRWYEYTGTTPEEMVGWGWQSVHDPEQLPRVLMKWDHSIKTGMPFEMVFPLKGADNIFRPFLTSVIPLLDSDGKILRWIGTNTDISKQKQAEDHFRQMADRMPQKIWTADAEGNRNYFNKVMIEYTGLTFDQLKDWGWKDIVHPDDWPATKLKWEHSIRTGEDFVMENRLQRKDGIYLWHLIRAIAVKDELGKIKMWIGSKTEIQEQVELSRTLGENLKASDERMQTILQHAPDAVISIDEDGIIRSWNSEAENIFGWSEIEAIGKTLMQTIIPERFHTQHIRGMKHFLKTGDGPIINKPVELSALKKNGSEFPIELKISTTKINDHFIFIGFIRDISIRKLAEKTIQNRTNQLIEAQQLAHIGSWEWDVCTNKIEWSDELYRIYGLTPQQFEADYENYLKYVHPEDRAYANEVVQQAFRDHQPFKFYHKVLWQDGTVRILSSTGKVITDENNNVIKMAGTAQDVTEQKKYEDELKLSEERFYRIFNSNPVPMTLAEIKTNRIIHANNLFFNLFGMSREEVIGHSSEELNLIDPEEYKRIIELIFSFISEERSIAEVQALSKEETEEIILKLRQSEKMKDFEILYTRKNGETFPAIISFEIIKLGEESYIVTSYQDITERKKSEALLKSQNEQLEKMNKELESFAYVSSHDLQEPLRKIQTFTGLLAKNETENLTEKGKEYFYRMQEAAKRMQTLIQDLLSYSRTNTAEKKFELVDLNEIVEEVKSELKEVIEEKQAVIESGELCKIKIIHFQFRQLMNNLIGNSLKFSFPGKPPVISIKSEKERGSKLNEPRLLPDVIYCHITVSDNGIGFDQTYSNKIFEVFQRLHGMGEYNGTGIGLAIVKKIVDNHNGLIKATGQINKGASFDIYIPYQ